MWLSFTFLLHNQISDILGLGQVSKYTDGFQNGVHAGAEHQLQHHWETEGQRVGVCVSEQKTHTHTQKSGEHCHFLLVHSAMVSWLSLSTVLSAW